MIRQYSEEIVNDYYKEFRERRESIRSDIQTLDNQKLEFILQEIVRINQWLLFRIRCMAETMHCHDEEDQL